MKKMEEKKTYPIRMAYYEPNNLCVFALTNKEI
jgi:hypothetical protein